MIEIKDIVGWTLGSVGWAWAIYQHVVARRSHAPHYVCSAEVSGYTPGYVDIEIIVRNRAPEDLYVHSVELLSDGGLYYRLSYSDTKVGPSKMIVFDTHIPAHAGGEFPSDTLGFWMEGVPDAVTEVCLLLRSSRRMDAKRSKSFKDCLTIQRQNTKSPD